MSVTRRSFLSGAAAASLAAVVEGHPAAAKQLVAALAPAANRVIRPPTETFSVERPTDLLQLDITFTGFSRRPLLGSLTSLVPGAGSFITVQFPPQAIGEAAYSYTPGTSSTPNPWLVDPPPVLSVMSGPSRLCFTTPSPVRFSSPMAVTDLLDWSSWTLLVPKVAAGAPADNVSAIEYPYALLLTPARAPEGAGKRPPASQQSFSPFAGRKQPLVSPNDVSDCWAAAFHQTPVGASAGGNPAMVAVSARDYAPGSKPVTPTGEMSIAYGGLLKPR